MKKVLICLLLLLTTGCTMQYNVKIHTDGSIEETITTLKDKDEKAVEDLENPTDNETYILRLATNYYEDNMYAIYNKKYIEKENLIGLKGTAYFKNFEVFQKGSKFISNMYSDVKYTVSGNNTKIMTIGSINLDSIYNPTLDVPMYPKDCYISISLPFEVINHNADKVENNTYYWLIDEKTENKDIMIEYNDQVVVSGFDYYLYMPINTQKIIFYAAITLGILIILGIIILLIKRRMDKNNEV